MLIMNFSSHLKLGVLQALVTLEAPANLRSVSMGWSD